MFHGHVVCRHPSKQFLSNQQNAYSALVYHDLLLLFNFLHLQAGMTPRVRDWGGGGGGVKANLTNSRRSMLRLIQLESVDVEVWPTRVGQCWGLTNWSRSVLRFGQLKTVNVEVWPTRVGQCWGLTNSSRPVLRFGQLETVSVEGWTTRVGQCWGLNNLRRSMLRFDQLESVNVEVWPTQILLLNKILVLAIFDGPTQSAKWGPPPPPGAVPAYKCMW